MIRVHAAILCLHGDFGEDGSVGGALDVAHIPYVGQDVYSSAVTQDKAYTKCIAEHLGIPTAKWILSTGEDTAIAKRRAENIIGYPMFIKPPRLGSSYGAHPIHTPKEFETAFADAQAYDGRVLIERLIEVEYEAECAMLFVGDSRRFSVGIIDSHGAFYDFQTKYSESERAVALPFCRDEAVVKRVCKAANMLSEYIGLRHLSRIDFFVTKDREILFNEINTFPGMTKTSLYPALTEKMGLSRGEFLSLLIESVCKDDGHI